jgi:hypothetical protein
MKTFVIDSKQFTLLEPEELDKRYNSPTLPQQAASLGNSLVNWTASGFAATPPDTLATREATCRVCPEWDAAALNKTGRCRICKCSTWAKLRMATERCPLGKWEGVSVNSVSSVVNPSEPHH